MTTVEEKAAKANVVNGVISSKETLKRRVEQSLAREPGQFIRVHEVATGTYRVNWWTQDQGIVKSRFIKAKVEGDSLVIEEKPN